MVPDGGSWPARLYMDVQTVLQMEVLLQTWLQIEVAWLQMELLVQTWIQLKVIGQTGFPMKVLIQRWFQMELLGQTGFQMEVLIQNGGPGSNMVLDGSSSSHVVQDG